MSWGLHHAHDVNTKRDLNSQLCPPALGHAELLGEAFASPFHCYSELPVLHCSTRGQSSRAKRSCTPTIKSALQLEVTWIVTQSVAPFTLKLSTPLCQAASPFKLHPKTLSIHCVWLTDEWIHRSSVSHSVLSSFVHISIPFWIQFQVGKTPAFVQLGGAQIPYQIFHSQSLLDSLCGPLGNTTGRQIQKRANWTTQLLNILADWAWRTVLTYTKCG